MTRLSPCKAEFSHDALRGEWDLVELGLPNEEQDRVELALRKRNTGLWNSRSESGTGRRGTRGSHYG
jgi:hypothetical protein